MDQQHKKPTAVVHPQSSKANSKTNFETVNFSISLPYFLSIITYLLPGLQLTGKIKQTKKVRQISFVFVFFKNQKKSKNLKLGMY